MTDWKKEKQHIVVGYANKISGQKWSGFDVRCFLVDLHPDHMYSFGYFFQWIRLSEICPWIKQISWPTNITMISMRFSCLTSKFVWIVLDTSIYFSRMGNNFSLGQQSGAEKSIYSRSSWSLSLGSIGKKNTVCLLLESWPPSINPLLIIEWKLNAHPMW